MIIHSKWFQVGAAVCAMTILATAAMAQEEDSLDRNYAEELPRIAPLEPDQALASFEIHPDFEIQIVAAEPLVHDPVAVAFDEAGRLYVVEMRGYSEQREENLGAVRCLEDTDGDGKMDKSTVLIDGLEWPTAVACWDGGVFIGVSPDIQYCKDTDGDGKADVREVVYTGFGLSNVQGLLNSFKWQLDNRIHGATSSSGAEVRPGDDPAAPPLNLRGRDYSFDPIGRGIRAESGGGQHGLTFDEYGAKYVCHNSNHCQFIHFEDRHIARNPYLAPPRANISVAADGPAADVFRISPVEPWRVVRTRLRVKGLVPGPVEGGGTAAGYFTSATGITVYKGDAFPEIYRGNLFIGDVGSNLVHRKTVKPDGLTMVANRADANTEFLRSTDIWFRPVQFANGPEGALYIADMYREVIEHPASLHPIIKQHLDLTSGQDRGRIYRIVPKGFEQPSIPDMSESSIAVLCANLGHANVWNRETAARLIYQRQDRAAVPILEKMAADRDGDAIEFMHAIYALHGLNAAQPHLRAALYHKHPRVREHGARIAGLLDDVEPVEDTLYSVYADETDLRARYEMIYAMGNSTNPQIKAQRFANAALSYPDDPWIRLAVLSGSADSAAGILVNMLGQPFRSEWHTPLARFAGASASDDQLHTLLAEIATPTNAQRYEGGQRAELVSAIIEGAAIVKRPGLNEILAQHPDTQGVITQQISQAVAVLNDEESKPEDRASALGRLGLAEVDVALPYINTALEGGNPASLQVAAIDAARQFTDVRAGKSIVRAWPGLGPFAKTRAIEALFSRETWLVALLDAIDAGTFTVSHLDSVRRNQLANHPDESIQERAGAMLAADSATPREEIVAKYQSALELAGDAKRGEAIYKEHCSQCHKIGSMGYAVGPDLTTMAQSGPDKILINVLDPNREVNPQYINYTVETSDWETYSGIISAESATSVTLRRANGAEDTILRVNIDRIQSEKLSIMPEGWEETIDPQGMADIIAFLSGLG